MKSFLTVSLFVALVVVVCADELNDDKGAFTVSYVFFSCGMICILVYVKRNSVTIERIIPMNTKRSVFVVLVKFT